MLKDGPVWALGAMSGTSLDGVDAAMLRTDGVDILEFGATGFQPYSGDEQETLHATLGHWGANARASELVENTHAMLLDRFEGAELIGFHGQTLAHDPRGKGTLQIGDGALLAEVLGKPVVWDFRSTDIEMGGQGAPLAPFYHFACARWIGADAPIAFLNLGGVANISWVDPRHAAPDAPGALLAFDTGPANGPINDLMQTRFGKKMDRDGALAATGQVAQGVIDEFLAGPYFHKMPPKSLDRLAFAALIDATRALSDADAAATLCAAVAAAVVKGAEHFPEPPTQVLVTGGGRKNPILMAMLRAGLGGSVAPVESVGLDGDMLEAQAFAYLAVRVARGLTTSCPGTTGVGAPVGGGRISWPRGA